jgi:AcrR family transcriptional regulator
MADGKRPLAGRRRGGAAAAPPGDGYHHGDLRAALIAAGEAELAEKGVAGFTLRGCARRAGVSHAAPAHHFKDVRALLTALATLGFRRLSASMEAHAAGIAPGSLDHVVAIGLGYVDFAERYPSSFGLIFSVGSLDFGDADLAGAATEAFGYPVRAVGAYYGVDDPMAEPRLAAVVTGIWSIVHGFSGLLLAGQFDKHLGADRKAAAARLVPPMLARHFAEDEAGRRDQEAGTGNRNQKAAGRGRRRSDVVR